MKRNIMEIKSDLYHMETPISKAEEFNYGTVSQVERHHLALFTESARQLNRRVGGFERKALVSDNSHTVRGRQSNSGLRQE